MPDDRLFHKRLGHSEKVNRLTDFEDIVWRQFILSADDFGVMRFSAITIQADNDRLARKPAKAVQRALERVRDVGLIATFEHQGWVYCYQADWQNHQRVKHPRQTINPRPTGELLEQCSVETRQLFSDWPGKKREKLEKDFGNVSETVPHLARAGARETANANGLRLEANGSDEKRGLAFDGRFLTVFRWQFTELGKRLAEQQREDFDLPGWFLRLETEIERAKIALPAEQSERWVWLLNRLYRDAGLKKPTLSNKREEPRAGGDAYKPYIPFAQREPVQ